MGKFNKLLEATYNPPRKWILNSSLSYDCDLLTEVEIRVLKSVGIKITKAGKVTVPKGFETDMASVPRACWMFIAPFDVARAAVIHDLLYKNIRQHRWHAQKYFSRFVVLQKSRAGLQLGCTTIRFDYSEVRRQVEK